MNCIYIGTLIKQRRKELKLTQEQVCSGICDPVTLSRIENGKQTPSKKCYKCPFTTTWNARGSLLCFRI